MENKPKHIVLYGYGLADVALFLSRLFNSCNRKVIVCDCTREQNVYACFKGRDSEMLPIDVEGIKYYCGYTDEPADIKIVTVGFAGLWHFENELNVLVTGYSSGKVTKCKSIAANIDNFVLMIKGAKQAPTGPNINMVSMLDNPIGLDIREIFSVGNNDAASARAEFFGIMEYEQLTKEYREFLKYVALECGVDIISVMRVFR